MRKYEPDDRFWVLEDIEEARQFRPTSFMERHFGRKHTSLVGAVHSSPFLRALAAEFNYETAAELPYRRETRFKNGSFSFPGQGEAVSHLNDIAIRGATYLEPMLGRDIYIGLYPQAEDLQGFHVHPGETAAILPLGTNQLSTEWKNAQGRIVTAARDTMVVVGEDIWHRSPRAEVPRAVLTFTSQHRK